MTPTNDNRQPATDQSSLDRSARRARGMTRDRALIDFLKVAPITESKLVPWGSNYTFAVALDGGADEPQLGIYKPAAGETPLWDFEAGTLYRREYASYLLCRLLGWHFIPPTVIRDGPHGIGTVQLYIEPDERVAPNRLLTQHSQELRQMMLFDLIANNADRKSGHIFIGLHDRQLWGIDHGLTFHVHPKLRTVIWEFCHEPINAALLRRIEALLRRQRQVEALLTPFLDPTEISTLFQRATSLHKEGRFPSLNPRRNIPYGW